jgi:alpha-tubulin suppressor-like RCC1 family protein
MSFLAFAGTPPAIPFLDTDQLIVRVRGPGVPPASAALERGAALASRLSMQGGELMAHHRVMGDGSHVMKLLRRLPTAQIEAIARRFADDAEVIEVLPDRIAFPTLTPNDPQFAAQWALSLANGVNAPGAWDVTTGSSNVVIGVIDTGKLDHADLAGRWIGGYDFIADTNRSNDGDGRDANAADPGDWVTLAESASGPLQGCAVTNSRWHGTAMAGIIAATGNNATGIAGLNWSSGILPVRVVGKCGGYTSDIVDGMRWAVGIAIPNVPANSNPADVLNVSLATLGACDSAFQTAINEVTAAGVPIVVSAGNNSASASSYSPGNCNGVITVAAVDRNGGLTNYSNTGSAVVLSAPGGVGAAADAVATTFDSGTTTPANDNAYASLNGTSIAAAHVTGIASLMLSARPTLGAGDVKEIVRNTSRAFPGNAQAMGSYANCSQALCGLGIADAAEATRAARAFGDAVPMIAGGVYHALALRFDGSVYQWGDDVNLPATISALRGILEVAGGNDFTLARRSDGIVYGIGYNAFGQLGDGTFTDRSSPSQAAGLYSVVEIAAGDAFGLARRSDGRVWSWGQNFSGQLGDGTTATRNTPGQVSNLTNVVAIAAGGSAGFALKSDGTVWRWGFGVPGAVPAQMSGLSGIVAIAGSNSHVLALKSDGTLLAQGSGAEVGDGTNSIRTTPVPVLYLTNVTRIRVGGSGFSVALRSDGTVWAWGKNDYGQVGDGTTTDRNAPVQVTGLDQVVAIGAGNEAAYAIRSDGSVFSWGRNVLGQLGNGTTGSFATAPVQVLGVAGSGFLYVAAYTDFLSRTGAAPGSVQVSNPLRVSGIANGSAISVTGGEYSIGCTTTFTSGSATIDDGQVVCVRVTSPGCGATGTVTLTIAGSPKAYSVTTIDCDTTPNAFAFTPVASANLSTQVTSSSVTITGINGPASVTVTGGQYSIGCGGTFTANAGTILNNQSLCVRQTSAASYNTYTQAVVTIGGVSASFAVTTKVAPGFSTTPMVSGGGGHSLALRWDGLVFSWGSPGGVASTTPTAVTRLSGVAQVAAGASFSLARRPDGIVLAWGLNPDGQLGDGTNSNRVDPVRVGTLGDIVDVAAGSGHALARANDGTLWSWGRNTSGQLGDGGTTSRNSPVQVPGMNGAIAIFAGSESSFAVKGDGSVWRWGLFGASQSVSPVQVAGLTQITAVAGSDDHLLALRNDGTVWALGENSSGQLGDGTNTDRAAPVQVSGLANVVGIGAGSSYSIALRSDGTLWTWGLNVDGQLGDGTTTARNVPTQVTALANVIGFDAGFYHVVAFRGDGSVIAWGNGTVGQLGRGSFTSSPLPSPVITTDRSGYFYVATYGDFVAQTDVAAGFARVSNPLRVSGIANGAAISIAGGSYSIGCTTLYTSGAGTVNDGDIVCARVNAASACGTTASATVTIAGFGARTFSVTTLPCDTTPDPFGPFNPKANVDPNAVVTSNTLNITGLTGPSPISITGGSYSIGCNTTFTSASGTFPANGSVCVRQISASTYDTFTQAVLTIGGVSATFDVTTKVAPDFNVTPMASAYTDSLAVRFDGTVFGWGYVWSSSVLSKTPIPIDSLSGVVKVASGNSFGVALRHDGIVLAWGLNTDGQVGDGTTVTTRPQPARVAGLSGITDIASGYGSTFALRNDGTVWSWGRNLFGELGDGTTTERNSPVQVAGLSGVVSIAPGFAVKADGTVWQWGLFMGFTHPTPVQMPGLSGIVSVAPGNSHLLALKSDGTVWAVGYNTSGQIGNGTTSSQFTPMQVPGLTNVVRIEAGNDHSLALKNDGTLWAWGDNRVGQVGDGSLLNRTVPTQVPGLSQVSRIAAGQNYNIAIRADGSVFSWGSGGPNLGIGSDVQANLPTQVVGVGGEDYLNLLGILPRPFAFLSAFDVAPGQTLTSNTVTITGLAAPASIAVAGGEYSMNGGAFTSAAGTIVNGSTVVVRNAASPSYSTTTSTTLTIGGVRSSTFFVRTRRDPNAAVPVPRLALGNSHSLVLNTDGSVYAFGYNGNGQLGNGTTLSTPAPTPVAGLSQVIQIASGAYHGIALKRDGTTVAWGSNAAGQLGYGGGDANRLYPTAVASLSNVSAIAGGEYHSAALKADGSVWAWGLNTDGQVGDGSGASTRNAPVQVAGLTTAVAIAAGGRHNLALLANGTVMAWGANESGQLGDGTTTSRATPVPVSSLGGVVAIAAGGAHSLAIRADGSVVAWGNNDFGQLGDGTLTKRSSPVVIATLGTGVGLIAAGNNHSLAVKAGGALYTWGSNANSQLGDGGVSNRTSPFQVATPTKVVAIAGGGRHSAAMDSSGKLFAWGDNFFGQVGNKSGNFSPHSASLDVLRGDSGISTGAAGSGSGGGTASASGSSVITLSDLSTGYDFGHLSSGSAKSVSGRFKNQAASENISGIAISVEGSAFSLAANTCPSSLVPDTSCDFSIAFSPSSAGSFSGQLKVVSSVIGSPEYRTLFGSADAPGTPALSLAASAMAFVPTLIDTSTAPQRISVSNTGSATLSVTSVVSGSSDFSATHDCQSVAAGGGCGVSIVFTPHAAGAREAVVTIDSNAGAFPITVSGTGAATGALGTLSQTITFAALPNRTIGDPPFNVSATASSGLAVVFSTLTSATCTVSGSTVTLLAEGTCTIAADQPGDATYLAAPRVARSFQIGAAGTSSNPARLFNISTRGKVLTGNDVMIAGFIIDGSAAKKVVINVAGPSLANYGIAGPLQNPTLTLVRSSDQAILATNDNWQTQANPADVAAINASGFQPNHTLEPAIIATLGPGAYTAIVQGANGGVGVGLVGVFEVDHPEVPMINISTRGQVLGGEDVMIAGFIVQGDSAKTVVVNVAGPSLANYGITNPLQNPTLTLVRSSDQVIIATNDNWQTQANPADVTAITNSGFKPNHTLEPAIIATLPPGAYTAIVSGATGGTGVGLVGVFAVP